MLTGGCSVLLPLCWQRYLWCCSVQRQLHPAYPRLFCHTVTISIFWIRKVSTDKHPNSHRGPQMQAGMNLFGTQICKHSWLLLNSSTCKKAAEIAYCSVKTRSKRGFDCFYFGLYLPQHAEGISTQLKQKIREQPTILHYKYNCISIRPESKIIL